MQAECVVTFCGDKLVVAERSNEGAIEQGIDYLFACATVDIIGKPVEFAAALWPQN